MIIAVKWRARALIFMIRVDPHVTRPSPNHVVLTNGSVLNASGTNLMSFFFSYYLINCFPSDVNYLTRKSEMLHTLRVIKKRQKKNKLTFVSTERETYYLPILTRCPCDLNYMIIFPMEFELFDKRSGDSYVPWN